ncbi:MAG: AtpZ/AtpI family protein [Gemmatimonadota bacterium]
MHHPNGPPDDGGGSGPGALAAMGRYGGYGLTIGLSTALFAWLGSIVDERLHSGPLFVILGTFIGFGAGFFSMYRHLVLSRRTDTPPGDSGAEVD